MKSNILFQNFTHRKYIKLKFNGVWKPSYGKNDPIWGKKDPFWGTKEFILIFKSQQIFKYSKRISYQFEEKLKKLKLIRSFLK